MNDSTICYTLKSFDQLRVGWSDERRQRIEKRFTELKEAVEREMEELDENSEK